MKKLLLSILTLAGMSGVAFADEATFDFNSAENITGWGYALPSGSTGSDLKADSPLTSGDVTITYDKGTSLAASGGQIIRFYKGTNGYEIRTSTNAKVKNQNLIFTANGGTITNVEFTGTVNLKASAGTLSSGTWTGSEASVTFTTTGQIIISKIVVTYTPSGKKTADLSFDNQSVTVIQGETYTGQTVNNPNSLTGITYASDAVNVAAVDANTGAVTIGTETGTAKITASFAGNDEYGEGSASYTITVAPAVNNLTEFNALAKDQERIINCELTVTYTDGKDNAFVTDGTAYQLIYQGNANYTYEVGDVLNAGWTAKMDNYNGLPEMRPVGAIPTVKEHSTFTPAEMTADDLTTENINRIGVLKDVYFASATPTGTTGFIGKIGDSNVNFANKFKIASVAAGSYNVTAIVTYNSNLRFNPIAFEATTTNGIDSIVADDAAEAEYYNLQGVRVAAPESGLYIVRRGNKVTKELVK